MVELPPQRVRELSRAGAFRAGGRKVLQAQGYSPEEAEQLTAQYRQEGKVYGRRSAGINQKEMVVTTGTIEAQQLEPVMVTDTSKGAIVRKYNPITKEQTSVRVDLPKVESSRIETKARTGTPERLQQELQKASIEVKKTATSTQRLQPPPIQDTNIRKADTSKIIKPQSVVTAYESPKAFLEKQFYDISRSKSIYETQQARGAEKQILSEAKQFGLGVASVAVGTALFAKNLFFNPIKTLKSVPGGITASAVAFGEDIKVNPSYALGVVAGNIAGAKATPKVVGTTGTITENILTRLDPRFKPVVTTIGGQFIENLPAKVGTSRIGLVQPGNLGNLNLAQQASFAGTTKTVMSAQRGLFGLFETTKVIDKPLPSPTAPPLEQAMFFSPPNIKTGVPELRISRLGLQGTPTASIFDLAGSSELTLGINRPQALVLPNAKIANIPSELKTLLAKAQEGDSVALAEFERRFLEYQLRPTGELQPIGFAGTREAELTLSPQSVLVKKGTPVVTIIEGKRVPIVLTEIKQPSSEASALISKLQKEGLTIAEKEKLQSLLKKETGLDYSKAIKEQKRLPIESSSLFIKGSKGISYGNSISVPTNIRPTSNILRVTQVPRSPVETIRSIVPRKEPIRTTPARTIFRATIPARPIVIQRRPPVSFNKLDKGTIDKNIQLESIDGYEIFTKKYGKDVLIGTAKTKLEAKTILERQLLGTLRASGFVTKSTGEKLKASELGFGRGFRTAKRDSFRVVQERGFRLGSFGERSEIKSARRRKR